MDNRRPENTILRSSNLHEEINRPIHVRPGGIDPIKKSDRNVLIQNSGTIQMNISSDHLPDQKLRVGVVFWNDHDGLGIENSGIIKNSGHDAISFLFNAKLPQNLDVVFVDGPYDSLVPLANQLSGCPVAIRPAFIWWLTEQLPNPALPEWILYWGGRLRSRAERIAYFEQNNGEWCLRPQLRWLTSKAHRFRYYGDLCWLRQERILSLLVTSSPWKAEYLRTRGFDPYVPPTPNYRPDWGEDLNIERDIPVLWLGKIATRRRKRVLECVRSDLKTRGVEIHVVDGVENPYIFGEERTRLLNRTKIMLNLLREEWDNHAARFAFAAQNRALLITEPTLLHTSFQDGEHIIQVPIEQIADTICYYLSHEEERQKIVEQAYQLIMKNSREEIISKLLQHVILQRNSASTIENPYSERIMSS